jgi:hypothetical protein
MNVKFGIKPQSGLISITTGETRGIKTWMLINPEGVEYHNCSFEKFNPSRVAKFFYRFQ